MIQDKVGEVRYQEDEIEEDKEDRSCSMNGRDGRACRNLARKPQKKKPFGIPWYKVGEFGLDIGTSGRLL